MKTVCFRAARLPEGGYAYFWVHELRGVCYLSYTSDSRQAAHFPLERHSVKAWHSIVQSLEPAIKLEAAFLTSDGLEVPNPGGS